MSNFNQNWIPVVDKQKGLYGLISPALCRILLKSKRIFVSGRAPFTVSTRSDFVLIKQNGFIFVSSISAGIDPGVKHTGISLFTENTNCKRTVFYTAILKHRGQRISRNLEKRRSLRSSRNNRRKKTSLSYRTISDFRFDEVLQQKQGTRLKKFLKPTEWLPVSVVSRLSNISRFFRRIGFRYGNLYIEDVMFTPTQIEEIFIDQHGWVKIPRNARDYVKWRDNYTCQYCGYDFIKNDFKRRLEIDHIVPRSRGGDNDRTNLICSCHNCNQEKSNLTLLEWYKVAKPKQKKGIEKLLKQEQKASPHKYSTLATITRKILARYLYHSLTTPNMDFYNWINKKQFLLYSGVGLGICSYPGYYTKQTRLRNNLPKDHHIDAACVGTRGVVKFKTKVVDEISSMGKGKRQMCRMNKYGFQASAPKPKNKRVNGFSSGDLVKLGKKIYYISTSRSNGLIAIVENGKQKFLKKDQIKSIKLLWKNNGYRYITRPTVY